MKRLSFALLALLASAALAAAQTIGVTPLTGGAGGGGSVTLATTCPSSSQTGTSLTLNNGANTQAESASYTVLAADCGKVIEASGATTTITLPSTIASGFQVTIGNVNAPAGANVTVALGGSNTANGVSGSLTLAPGQFIGIFAGSGVSPTNWDVAGVNTLATQSGPGYSVGQWYVGSNFQGVNAAGAALSLGTAYCSPEWLLSPSAAGGGSMTIGSITFRQSTAGTPTTVTSALYQDTLVAGIHRPGTLLGYTAQVANTVGQDGGALNAGVSVKQSLYWFCVTQGDSTGKVSLMSIGFNLPYVGNASSAAIFTNTGDGLTFPVTYGASAALTWPADASGLSFSESNNLPPLVLFQLSSIP